MDKQDVVYPYNEMLFSLKKEDNSGTLTTQTNPEDNALSEMSITKEQSSDCTSKSSLE